MEIIDVAAPAIARRGIEANITSVSNHPFTKAKAYPAKNVASNCINFPT